MGCFLKSSKDGQPRGPKPIDVVLVLDISGSMNRPVSAGNEVFGNNTAGAARGGGGTRLDLAKEAVCSLFSSLREDDRFGLAIFNTDGKILQPLALKPDVDPALLS